MSYFSVDIEADGPVPGLYSMVSFGAVLVDDTLDKTFYSGILKPISPDWKPDALAVSNITREEMENGRDPESAMLSFNQWISENSNGQPIFIADNNGFDYAFINYYFHKYLAVNPFGWSSRRIGDMFCGFMKNSRFRWKQYRKTQHTHNPVDDAKGNAEAILALRDLGYKIKLD